MSETISVNIEDFYNPQQAACRGMDAEIFFPNAERKDRLGGAHVSKEAVVICNGCEVRKGCLDYSLHYEPIGVWGGYTEVEREYLRRKRGIELPIFRQQSTYIKRANSRGSIDRRMRNAYFREEDL
jgi:WhiB family redox-sensing transcriptional regulator